MGSVWVCGCVGALHAWSRLLGLSLLFPRLAARAKRKGPERPGKERKKKQRGKGTPESPLGSPLLLTRSFPYTTPPPSCSVTPFSLTYHNSRWVSFPFRKHTHTDPIQYTIASYRIRAPPLSPKHRRKTKTKTKKAKRGWGKVISERGKGELEEFLEKTWLLVHEAGPRRQADRRDRQLQRRSHCQQQQQEYRRQ